MLQQLGLIGTLRDEDQSPEEPDTESEQEVSQPCHTAATLPGETAPEPGHTAATLPRRNCSGARPHGRNSPPEKRLCQAAAEEPEPGRKTADSPLSDPYSYKDRQGLN